MADPIYVAQPGGGQIAVQGLSPENISAMVANMSAKAGSAAYRSTPVAPNNPKPTSASGQVDQMSNSSGGSSVGVSSNAANNQANTTQTKIQNASKFVPEKVAGYTDGAGVYHPSTWTVDPKDAQYTATDLQGNSIDRYGNKVSGVPTNTGDQVNGGDPMSQLIWQRMQKKDEEWQTMKDLLTSRGENDESNLAEDQKRESGANTAALARMGALNTSVSGMSYLQRLDTKHMKDLQNLRLQNQMVIFQAQQAFDENDFKLTTSLLQRADKIKEDARIAVNDFYDNLMKAAQIKKYEADTWQGTLDNLTKAGIDPSLLPAEYLEHIDFALGLPTGTSGELLTISNNDKSRKIAMENLDVLVKSQGLEMGELNLEKGKLDIEAAVREATLFGAKQAKAMYETLKVIPFGQPVTINGTDYYGADTSGMAYQADADGVVTAIIPNPYVPSGFITQNLGKLAASRDSLSMYDDGTNTWVVDLKTNRATPIWVDAGTGQDPQGMIAGAYGGQCGTYVRVNGGMKQGDIPNDKAGKLKLIDKSITPENVQGGDVFVQDIGPNGHVGFIQSVFTDKNGKAWVRTNESNIKGDEKVASRVLAANDPALKGFFRPPKNPFLETGGTDAPSKNVATPVRLNSKPEAPKSDPLDTLLPESILKKTGLPVGSTFGDAKKAGKILTQDKPDENKSYDLIWSEPDANGMRTAYGYDRSTNTLVLSSMGAKGGPTDTTKTVTPTSGTTPAPNTPGGPVQLSSKKTEETKKLTPSELADWNKMYPDAGINSEDTRDTVTTKTKGMTPVTEQKITKPSVAEQNAKNAATTARSAANKLRIILKGDPSKKIPGLDLSLGTRKAEQTKQLTGFGMSTSYTQAASEIAQLKTIMATLLTMGAARSGGSLSENQIDQILNPILPNLFSDDSTTFNTKMNSLESLIADRERGLGIETKPADSGETKVVQGITYKKLADGKWHKQ